MKILDLYAGLGGNRKDWPEECKVTAVEYDSGLASVYRGFFPGDTVVVADAHQYLLDHYKEFDFIWSSPPCPTHSSFRHNICVRFRGTPPAYPDMRLYQEVLFLQHHCSVPWAVENVVPYYAPLIMPSVILQRHMLWTNFEIAPKSFAKENLREAQIPDLQAMHGFNLSGIKIPNKRQILRNCVSPEIGLYVYEQAFQGRS